MAHFCFHTKMRIKTEGDSGGYSIIHSPIRANRRGLPTYTTLHTSNSY